MIGGMVKDSSNKARQFRFAYFARRYEDTVAFYRESLGLAVLEAWDRSAHDRGTVFGAASGMIEVLADPSHDGAEHLFDARPPQGAFMVIEVDHVDRYYDQVRAAGVPVEREILDQSWGHRSFLVREPNGLTLYFFSES